MCPTSYPRNGKYRYTIAMREPYQLPKDVINIPAPPQLPSPPASPSLLTLLIPPAITIAGSVISALALKTQSWIAILPMMLMGLGYTAASLVTSNIQKKKYLEIVENRKKNYQTVLKEYRASIEGLIERQRVISNNEFPNLDGTLEIGFACGRNKRLWWRCPGEVDFLNLRLGSGETAPAFSIEPPNVLGGDDPLYKLPFDLVENYQVVTHTPFLVDLKRVGSLLVYSEKISSQIRLARRLLVDLIVHHSPEDISLFVLSDRVQASEAWEWLRWTPHVHALDSGYEGQNLLFDIDKINHFLDTLKRIYFERLELKRGYGSSSSFFPSPSIVVLLDDTGQVRQNPDIAMIAAEGHACGIFLIFLTNEKVPRTCRSRVVIDNNNRLSYLEMFESQGSGEKRFGIAELVSGKQADQLARVLAGMEVAGGKHTHTLPTVVKMEDIIEGKTCSFDQILTNWQDKVLDSDQVLLPVGQFIDRSGLSTFEIDFRPESIGGKGAYHAMMIGTTGSGKSIFMQSMVLASAYKYSPRHINFMFMDFKAGAAELKKISNLPHSVGMVTDLSPALADRALQALENELAKRKIIFDNAGKITDIWDFNRRFPDQAIPHLLVVIDEFAEGINILPNLVERLKELGRQGRAFGIYFFLANQEVNSAVEALKSNVGWYILLKVNRREEMNLVGQNYPVPPGRGRGYIKVKNEVTTIQGAYAGSQANTSEKGKTDLGEYNIQVFGLDGQRKEIFRFDPRVQKNFSAGQTELDLLMNLIEEAAEHLQIPIAQPIYLEPLQELIPFSQLIANSSTYRWFEDEKWERKLGERNVVPMGYLDIPNRCMQTPFSLNFNEAGGHLWVIGNPGSGKSSVLLSLATMLSLTHTPEEVQIFALDFGSGSLACLSNLPHTGAVIKPHESERIERVFRYLNQQLLERTERNWWSEGAPDIYLFVNNIADFRQQYPEQTEELARFIRSGGAVGIHMVITSNRGSELARTISGNILRRIVLQLADRQEYMDVLNTIVPPLSVRTEGRGYYVSDAIVECQIAIPQIDSLGSDNEQNQETMAKSSSKQQRKDLILRETNQTIFAMGDQMKSAWKGQIPPKIISLPEIIDKSIFSSFINIPSVELSPSNIPIALRYDDLSPVFSGLGEGVPFWTILGPRESGKSNFLRVLIYYTKKSNLQNHSITYIDYKKSTPSIATNDIPDVTVIADHQEIIQLCQNFHQQVIENADSKHVLLIDNIGIPFANNDQQMIQALKQLGEELSMTHNKNFMVVIADMVGNLKTPQAFSSPILKLFQQSQTGIFFSMDDYDMQWFNTRISIQQKKTAKSLTGGRGFLVRKGKVEFLQVPFITTEDLLT